MVFSPSPGILIRSALVPLLSVLSIDFFCVEERVAATFLFAAAVFGSATVMPFVLVVVLVVGVVFLTSFLVAVLVVLGVVFAVSFFVLVGVVFLTSFFALVGVVFLTSSFALVGVVFLSSFACSGDKPKDNTIIADNVLVMLIYV